MTTKTSVRNTMMLANLSISTWTGRKVAKDQARKIERDSSAKSGTVSAVKHLFAGVKELDEINRKATFTRVEFGKRTVPWFDTGPRAYNAAAHFDLMEWIKDQRAEFKGLVSQFLPLYPSLRANRQFELGTLFNDRDFPEPSEMSSKFRFSFDVMPVPNSEDIRVIEAFTEEDAEALAATIAKRTEKKLQQGLNHAADQLATVIKNLHNRLKVKAGDTGGMFRDSLVENIAELVELMPMLNISNDPELTKLTAEAKKMTQYSPDDLRSDETKRAKAANEAKALARKLSDAFGGNDE